MHGRRSRGDAGDKSPRIWRRGTLMQIVPLRFLSNRYKKERYVAFKIRQNPFSARALPLTPLGELTTLPRPPSWLERGRPSRIPPHSAPTHLRCSPCVPLRIPARSRPMLACPCCRKFTWSVFSGSWPVCDSHF